MLARYRGPICLRSPEPEARPEPVVPGNYWPRKKYPTPPRYNAYGFTPRPQLVSLEEELAEIRARHAARREYHRVIRIARKTRNATDHRAVDESTA